MFKDLLVQWITEINDKLISVGQSGYLAIGIDSFNATLYGYMQTIRASVVMPIAMVVLAIFCVLELYKQSVKIDGAGGGATLGAEIIFRVMVRVALCKLAVDSSLLFTEALYGISLKITRGVSSVLATQSITGGLDVASLTTQINQMGIGAQLGMFVELLIVKFAVFIILGLVQVICIARFIEIYVFTAVSPLPIAFFPSDELRSISINFLKSFGAVCLQGVFIYVVLSVFPLLFNSNILGDTSVFGILLYVMVLALGVFGAGRWAKSLCNAM